MADDDNRGTTGRASGLRREGPPKKFEQPSSASSSAADPTRGSSLPADGRARVVIEDPTPAVAGGRFPIKRVTGEPVVVEADVFADGHDVLRAEVRYRRVGQPSWRTAPMQLVANDRWRGVFTPETSEPLGRWEYTVRAWVDRFGSWRRDLVKRVAAGQDVALELRAGAEILDAIAAQSPSARTALAPWIAVLTGDREPVLGRAADDAASAELEQLARRLAAPFEAVTLERPLPLIVEPPFARFSAWYELFPRSASDEPGRHGTLRDVEARLPYVAELGFDILYLPPIHPIGSTARKGQNNSLKSAATDPGSPWAIGSPEGGHQAVHPALGELEDLRRLASRARELGIELALDVAFQTSPDHPWVREHPQWFAHRPDGSIRYAENPPKKYQDIYPIDFESEDWRNLWPALAGVFTFWLEQGVRVFRVDNPHTKSLRFWEWCLAAVKHERPDAVFLSEAFTRPKLMRRLAKAGFTQSYTYFPWRNDKRGLTAYLTELCSTPVREYLRPSQWVNTPDILTEYLQTGGRPAFITRLVLAATLGASYGVYGPAFELCEGRPLREGSEEYLDSEKFQIRAWDLDHPDSLRQVVARLNRIRREHPALQQDRTLLFHEIDNPELLVYSKTAAHAVQGPEAGANEDDVIVVVVNLDPHHVQVGWVWLDLHALGLPNDETFQVHDLLSDARFLWRDEGNYIALDPTVMPAHVLRVRRRVRSEADFDYYL